MVSSLTYKQAAADIISMSAAGDTLETQKQAAEMCLVFSEFLRGFAEQTNGYMVLAAFTVTFTEMKKIIDGAQGQDKVFLEELVKSIIGSFGRTVQ